VRIQGPLGVVRIRQNYFVTDADARDSKQSYLQSLLEKHCRCCIHLFNFDMQWQSR
jgi:hypothetical protein